MPLDPNYWGGYVFLLMAYTWYCGKQQNPVFTWFFLPLMIVSQTVTALGILLMLAVDFAGDRLCARSKDDV